MMTFFVTFACKCSFLVKRFRFYRNLLLFFEFRYYPYYYLFIIILFFPDTRLSSQISKTASHSATKLHSYMDPYLTHCSARFGVDPDYRSGSMPDPCFQIFLNISETNYRIINCNISNRRSSQELPFIFFELRAATCL